MAKVIVTGGAGFIGHHLVHLLLKEGHKVEVWDNLSTGNLEKVPSVPHCIFRKVDVVTDELPILEVDWVFHLAAPTSVQESLENPIKYRQGCLESTKRMLNWATRNKVSFFGLASTAAVYGERQDVPFAEYSKLSPMSPYAKYKQEAEELVKAFRNESSIRTSIFRFFNVFGEGQHNTGSYAPAVALFLNQHNYNKALTVTGDGTQTRDYIYVKDICRAMITVAEHVKFSPTTYNVGSGKETSIIKIAKTISDNIQYIPARLEPKRSCADISNITSEVGWVPSKSIVDWIKEIL